MDPCTYMKLHGQPCLFIRHFHKTQASNSVAVTCSSGTLALFNGVLQSHLAPAKQGSASASPPTTTPTQSSSKTGRSYVPNLISSCGVAFRMAIAPLNRVMILMQCQNEMIRSGRLSHPYKGNIDCFARTVRNEGIISLWKGNTAHMMAFIIPKVITHDMMFNYFRSLFKKEEDSRWKRIANLFAANSLSSAITLLFIHPLESAETRMANDIKTKSYVEKRQFNCLIDVFKKTLKSDGIAGLYRGFNISFVASFIGDLVLLVLHQNLLPKEIDLQHSKLAVMVKLLGIPLTVELITHPAQTVIRRMMMRSGQAIKYKSWFDAFWQIIKNEGVKSLYKGASAVVIDSVIVSGLGVIYLMIFQLRMANQLTIFTLNGRMVRVVARTSIDILI